MSKPEGNWSSYRKKNPAAQFKIFFDGLIQIRAQPQIGNAVHQLLHQ